MHQKRLVSTALAILICFPFLCSYYSPALASATSLPVDSYAYTGSVTSCEINSNSLVIKGAVQTSKLTDGSALYAYELPIFQDEKAADYPSLTPAGVLNRNDISSSGDYTFTISLSKIKSIGSKFVVSLSNQTLVDCAKYILNSDVLASNKEPYPTAKSIKGLQVQMNSDAERLGVQHAAINVTLNSMLALSNHGEYSIAYTYNGKKYYFVKEYIESLDATFAPLSYNHIIVNVILLLPSCDLNDSDLPNKDLVHPDAKSSMQNYVINAFNLTNKAGADYYCAMLSFLSQRYNGSNSDCGTINGYIVGNEIGMRTYNNMGDKPVEEYAMQYERQLRLTNTIVKQARSSARVYVSLEHFWAKTAYDYVNRQLIDLINYYSKKGGDYDWNIAFHPYPDNLFDPKTWNDTNTTDSFDTVKINFKNLQVLPRYLKQTGQLYNGNPRRIILSEEGFHTPAPAFMEYEQKIQAAAYVYAYYKAVSIPEVDAFILHRHVDHAQEADLKLGLWDTLDGEVVQPGTEKYIYNVFKNIDTEESKKVTAFALEIISENNTKGLTYSNWKQLIPEYSDTVITAKCNRPVQSTAVCANIPIKTKNVIKLSNEKFSNWYATDNTSSAGIVPEISGDYLTAKVSGVSMKDYKGFTFKPVSALNLDNKDILMVDVTATNIGDSKAEYMIRAYSKDKVVEGSTSGFVDGWNTIYLDISRFKGASSIDRIKVWARPLSGIVVWSSGSISVKNLVAANVAAEDLPLLNNNSSINNNSNSTKNPPTKSSDKNSSDISNGIISQDIINSSLESNNDTVSNSSSTHKSNLFSRILIILFGIIILAAGVSMTLLFQLKKRNKVSKYK